ncbi:hypothetical protein KKE03_05280 [Patescibacteria group bacterium]|nr:hypothetical protein [Patescibacteria group bacterium]
MQIDVEPRDLGQVVQLVAKPDGWKPEETRYNLNPIYIGGDPNSSFVNYTPKNLIKPLQVAWSTTQKLRQTDFNGLKVAAQRISIINGILQTDAVITDYYTAWGLPQADASKALFAEHERQVVVNRADAPNASYETNIPWAVCSHNVLLDPNGRILMMVRSQSQGFNARRVSVTEEEQMEPALDFSPFGTSFRSFHEELDVIVLPQRIRLLGIAMEKGVAYPAYCFIAETVELAENIEAKWRKARDYNENTALFAIEMTEVDRWLQTDDVRPDVWRRYLLGGNIAADAILKLHATAPWRMGLAKVYTVTS